MKWSEKKSSVAKCSWIKCGREMSSSIKSNLLKYSVVAKLVKCGEVM